MNTPTTPSKGNEPAWPVPSEIFDKRDGTYGVESTGGMTLRQWYAGLAMQGLCANSHEMWVQAGTSRIAECAAAMADAQLAALGDSP